MVPLIELYDVLVDRDMRLSQWKGQQERVIQIRHCLVRLKYSLAEFGQSLLLGFANRGKDKVVVDDVFRISEVDLDPSANDAELAIALGAVVRYAEHLAVRDIGSPALRPCRNVVRVHLFEGPHLRLVRVAPDGA